MRIIEIKTFEQVILCTLQRKLSFNKMPVLTFSELWTACSSAGPRLPNPVDADLNRKEFSRRLFENLEFLETMDFVTVRTEGDGRKVDSVHLTDKGEEKLKSITYSHQERLSSPTN